MSLVSIIQGAARDLAVPPPVSVASSGDSIVLDMFQLANKEGKALLRTFDWQTLTRESSFTTTATAQQITLASATPTTEPFYRFVNSSMWNRTQSRSVYGPLSPQDWQRKLSSTASGGIREWWRVRGDAIVFYPVPTAGDSVYFEYITKNWALSSTGVSKDAFTADDDTTRYDEELMRLGIVWRFKQSKGFDYAESYRDYQTALEDICGPDGSKGPIDLTGVVDDGLGINIPEGSWAL